MWKKNAIPQEARIVNKPDPFYITHIKAILFIVNIILAFFFIFLLIGIILIVRAYRKLRIINTELASEREKAEALSLHDTLTGLFNRRAIQPMIVYEMNRKKDLEALFHFSFSI
jgi:PleD family two-component response regulator